MPQSAPAPEAAATTAPAQAPPDPGTAPTDTSPSMPVSSSAAAGGGNDSRADVYADYFEPQLRGEARCGLHALNNALGFDFLGAEDMSRACDVLLAELAHEGNPEPRDQHELPSGWYSEAVMATALRVKDNLYQFNVDAPLLGNDDDMMRIFTDYVRGVVVNLQQQHWVAVRVVAGDIWLLDSLTAPRLLTFDDLVRFVRTYRHAFLVETLLP